MSDEEDESKIITFKTKTAPPGAKKLKKKEQPRYEDEERLEEEYLLKGDVLIEEDEVEGNVEDIDDLCEDSEEMFGKPCFVSKEPDAELSMIIVRKLLRSSNGKMCVTRCAAPNPGEAFMFDRNVVNDLWEKDGYEWQIVSKDRKSIVNDSTIVYSVYVAQHHKENKMMTRMVYSESNKRNVLLVYYRETVIHRKLTETPSDALEAIDEKDEDKDDEELTTGFDYQVALDMLSDCEDKLSTESPTYPKGGEIYFYDRRVVGDQWKFDSYIWRNCGRKLLPAGNPRLMKSFYLIRSSGSNKGGSTAFRRYTYQSLAEKHFIMVHYAGDESVYIPRPHGNAKSLTSSTYKPSPSRKHSQSRNPEVLTGPSRVQILSLEDQQQATAPAQSLTQATNKNTTPKKRAPIMLKRPVPAMFCDQYRLLSFDFVLATLSTYSGPFNTNVALFPKGGEVYVYRVNKMKCKWKRDCYKWAEQRSTSYYPRQQPEVVRRIHCIKLDSDDKTNKKGSKVFQRCCYNLCDQPDVMLVHYVGEETVAGRPENFDEQCQSTEYMNLLQSKYNFVCEDEGEEEEEEGEDIKPVEEVGTPSMKVEEESQLEPPQEEVMDEVDADKVFAEHNENNVGTNTVDEEEVQNKLQILNDLKQKLQLQEKKLELEIKALNNEKVAFFEQHGYA